MFMLSANEYFGLEADFRRRSTRFLAIIAP